MSVAFSRDSPIRNPRNGTRDIFDQPESSLEVLSGSARRLPDLIVMLQSSVSRKTRHDNC
jgi:hypothetical protein